MFEKSDVFKHSFRDFARGFFFIRVLYDDFSAFKKTHAMSFHGHHQQKRRLDLDRNIVSAQLVCNQHQIKRVLSLWNELEREPTLARLAGKIA